MPYITAATHEINGFYEDALWTTKNGRVILYAKRSSDASVDVNEGNMEEGFKKIKDSDSYTNNFHPIAVTSMIEPVSIQTSMRWEQGGNIIDAFKLGIKSGMNSVTNAAAELINNASKGIMQVVDFTTRGDDGGFIDATQRKMNLLMRKYRRKVISAASAYKNYGGSDTSISLPQLEFTFPALDFNGTHMKRCYNVLSYLLPVHTIKSKKEMDADTKQDMDVQQEENNTQENRKAESQNILDSTYWMYETPPNNYVNPAMGFNTSFLEGTFALDISGTVVKDLIPTAVTLVQSRARVISESDYVDTSSKHCMDEFYSGTQLEYMRCKKLVGQTNKSIPVVVRLYVQFEFARNITIEDYQNMFFEGVDLREAKNPYRHDDLSHMNTGTKSEMKEGEISGLRPT